MQAVSTQFSARIRTDTFREALRTALNYHPTIEAINLVVDGGCENNNATVDEFIASAHTIEIRKLRALKDVCFSNSHAEAANRIIKTAYLNQIEIRDTGHLYTILSEVIHDFSFVRPHGSLQGLIPFEYYTGKSIDTAIIEQQLIRARTERILINKKFTCPRCLFE